MSVERNDGIISFGCDNCGEYLDTETDDWTAANAFRATKGWLAVHNGEEWEHFCDKNCRDEYKA